MELQARDLKKCFGGVQAVDGCGFDAPSGRVTALVGPNGAGKTTVFNLISGMMAPDAGQIRLGGEDITRLPAWKRARLGLSRTFQLSRLFKNLSIRDNLLLALRTDDDEIVKMFRHGAEATDEEIDEVGKMLSFVGLEKDPSAPVTELSYGQQKLFDLARALINPHRFLMLDEPVAGVNPVLRERLQEILRALKERGETILVIEHDMAFVRAVADRVIVMDQGAVLAEGSPEEVLADKKVLEAYLGG